MITFSLDGYNRVCFHFRVFIFSELPACRRDWLPARKRVLVSAPLNTDWLESASKAPIQFKSYCLSNINFLGEWPGETASNLPFFDLSPGLLVITQARKMKQQYALVWVMVGL